MADPKKQQSKKPKKVKVLSFVMDNVGGFGYQEFEIDESLLGEPVDSSLPDVFAIFKNNLVSKAREIFGI